MASITTRAGKGAPLLNTEVDANFNNLNDDKVENSRVLTDVPAGALFTDTVYVHSLNAAADINTSGATIVDSIVTDAEGHITGMATRVMTLADLGYTGETDATADQTKADIDALNINADTLDGQHASAFEPADATILKDADIGVNVQAYDVNTAKVDVAADWATTQSYNRVTLTDAATINWNMATSPSAIVSLSANRTMGNPTNIKAGNWYTLRVYHSGAPRTLAWSSYWKFGGNGAPGLSTITNAYDLLTFYAHSITALSFVGIAKNISVV
jgi:hypothetical protein